MKKILFSLLLMFPLLGISQVAIDTFTGGFKVTNSANGAVNYYSCSSENIYTNTVQSRNQQLMWIYDRDGTVLAQNLAFGDLTIDAATFASIELAVDAIDGLSSACAPSSGGASSNVNVTNANLNVTDGTGNVLLTDIEQNTEDILQEALQDHEAREVIYIRLDGDSGTPTAIPFDPDDAEATGAAGVSYTLNSSFYSYSIVWLRTAAQDSQLTVNQRAYLAGAATSSAGYPTLLPSIQNDTSEIYNDDYTFTAGAGAAVEIAIKKPK